MWSVYVESNFLESLIAPENPVLGSIRINCDIVRTPLLALADDMWIFTVITTGNIRPFL